ncbi:helix-turn-helix domain-containing protein [Pseudomonas syringae pv. atrofaciens]|uniref:Helix-turn-helix domain-containing protein n=1 Tax=Pseudomonas syringae pv. atrofaciens TaxID=192087 RepID=A0AAD0MX10_PSESX|nr:helix-turn-helix domain-containing protein [Pseudomonas syringae pv. atrofaciens]
MSYSTRQYPAHTPSIKCVPTVDCTYEVNNEWSGHVSYRGIVLSEDEEVELNRRFESITVSQREGRRAQVILLAAQGCSRNEIARLTGLSVVSVTRWCKRFRELRLQGLVDLPGRGRKSSLPAEALRKALDQVTQPCVGHARWSCRSMAKLVGISPASVQRIWAANNIRPHLANVSELPSGSDVEEKSSKGGGGISETPE